MVWRTDGNHEGGSECAKVRWELVPYMRGRAIDLGCGPFKAFPHFVGVDSGKDTQLFGVQMKPNVVADVTDLSGFAGGEYDCVFSSHTLEHVEDYHAALKEWWRLVKVGGYLCLYLPHADLYPQCKGKDKWEAWYREQKEFFPHLGAAIEAYVQPRRSAGIRGAGAIYAGTPYANPDHLHDFRPEDIVAAMKKIGGGFDLVTNETRDAEDEYSFFMVFKKLSSGVRESWKNHKPAKTCAVVRYGAIGDMVQTSTLFPWLKEHGYHVTLYCQSGNGFDAVRHDPHIDRFIIQDKDGVPPPFLSEFWKYTSKKYDKWVNLCESIEGTLLACPDRVQFEWPNILRAKYLDRNYLEWTHELAEVPPPFRPKFYSTKEEQAWARREAGGRKNILWSLAGSSGHKAWPHVDAVIAGLMHQYLDVHVYLVGDEACQIVEAGWQQEPRVHCKSGRWTIRESLAFSEVADLIIGTETGLLNAAGMLEVPKIITLSHSSEEMLVKHWKNTTVLKQPEGVGCPKRWKANGGACRQLHGASGFSPWIDCSQDQETGTSLCQVNVSPDMMFQAIRAVLDQEAKKAA